MDNCKEDATPVVINYYMDSDEVGLQVDSAKYRALINSLLYLIASRSYIQFSVCMCEKESHYKYEKSILKYLKGTTNVGLWSSGNFKISLSEF